jgi:hypothetical protein
MDASNNDKPPASRRREDRVITLLRIAIDVGIGFVVAATIYVIGGWTLTIGDLTITAPTVLNLQDCTTCTEAVLDLAPPGVSVISQQVSVTAPSDISDYLTRAPETLLPATVLVFALRALRGVVTSLRQGSPFTTQNTKRLHRIGFELAVLWPLTYSVSVKLANDRIESGHLGELADLHVWSVNMAALLLPIFLGLVMLTVAAVFRVGMRLREDVEGLV